MNNYFQRSHNETFSAYGNPNAIRSYIPVQQRVDARKEHYYLGFDKSLFKPAMEKTYDFERTKSAASAQQNSERSARMMRNSAKSAVSRTMTSGAQASIIASKQKECHISIGGAPSNQKSVQGDNKTSN